MTTNTFTEERHESPSSRLEQSTERDRPLRILLAIPLYPPVVGGAEMHVSRLAAALARRGHDVHVLTTYAPPMPRRRHWCSLRMRS